MGLSKLDISDIISAIAILVAVASLIVSIVNIIHQGKMNRTNLEAKYFEKVFDTYLLNEIPEKMRLVRFDPDYKLNEGYKELNAVMRDMIKAARYFNYSKHDFYKDLCDKTVKLDEKLVNLSGKAQPLLEERNRIIQEIEDDVSKIILFINSNYKK